MIARTVASMRSQFAGMTRAVDGCTVIERPGVTAAVVPSLPERSLPNSVFYSGADALFEAYDELTAAYEDAGVRAWTVWAPPGEDESVGARLAERGHAIDGTPMAMQLDLAQLGPPPPGEEPEIERTGGGLALGELNDRAYGMPVPTFVKLLGAIELTSELYLTRVDGRPACGMAIHDHGDDAVVVYVATDPDFQRRGLAGRLLHRALRDARERGQRFSTLQASRAGEPVYARLGYERFGRFTMWERRKG